MSIEKFWATVDKSGDCWQWTGHIDAKGYGKLWFESKNVRAHRLAWLLVKGELPPAPLVLDHLCRNKACVNPEHLEPVTSRDNTLRGRGTAAVNSKKTHCIKGHEFEESNIMLLGRERRCRECSRRRRREWYARRKSLAIIKEKK